MTSSQIDQGSNNQGSTTPTVPNQLTNIREGWLRQATELINEDLFKKTVVTPKSGGSYSPYLCLNHVRMSCSWIKGRRTEKAVGVCFPRSWRDGGGINEIFITPQEWKSADVLNTLLHELIHAVDDNRHGHKTFFKDVGLAVGLMEPMTSSPSSETLTGYFETVVKRIGEYPHKLVALHTIAKPNQDPMAPKPDPTGNGDGDGKPSDGRGTQKGRLRTVHCPENGSGGCKFIMYISGKNLERLQTKGLDTIPCPCCGLHNLEVKPKKEGKS